MFKSIDLDDLKNKIKSKIYKKRSPEEWLKLISSICQTVLSFRDRPTKLDYLAFAVKMTSDLFQYDERGYLYSVFEDMKWLPLQLPNIVRDFLVEIFAASPVDTIAQNKNSVIYKIKIDDVTFAWCQSANGSVRVIEGSIHTDCHKNDKILTVLQKCVWNAVKTNHIVIGSTSNALLCQQITLYPDDFKIDEEYIEPDVISTVIDHIQKFKALGLSRSFVFHGVPGTGKSTLMRAITQHLGVKSIRIKTSDIKNDKLNSHFFETLIQIVKPTVLIIDDLDRIETRAASILDMIEKYRNIVNVTMASMNRINAVDAALIRPGRFDEHVLIDVVDSHVLSKFVADKEPERETIQTWPIAFIREYANVVKIFGLESDTTRQIVKQLKIRVEDQKKQYETLPTRVQRADCSDISCVENDEE